MTKTELKTTVKDIRELESMMKEIKAEIELKKSEVSAFMVENNTKKFVGDDFTITVSEYERKTLDKASLVADFGSLEDYEKISLCTRLLIK